MTMIKGTFDRSDNIGLKTDPFFESKLSSAVDGLAPYYRKCIVNLLHENAKLVVDFINSEVQFKNIKVSTKKGKIEGITTFANFLKKKYGHEIPFKQSTREDFIDFQTSLRKSEEADRLHKWVGTYNQFLRVIKPFYKWLFSPDHDPKNRKIPPILEGINQLHRKEVTTYTGKDMWTDEDDQLFLKYCEDPLIKLYHTMSRDISNRPHELLRVRIGDIIECTTHDGKKYAKFTIGAGCKTKQREVVLYHSYPDYIEYLQKYHPTKLNPNSFLFKRRDARSLYTNIPIKPSTLSIHYWTLRNKFFPKLLGDPEVPIDDRNKIQLLLQKPWNPYVRRHTALSEKVKSSKINEYNLRKHAGWSKNSKMLDVYTHELGDSSSEAILDSWGLVNKDSNLDGKPKIVNCICGTPNNSNSKYCINSCCNRVLAFDGYNEIEEEKRKKDARYDEDMKELREEMNRKLGQIMSMIRQNPQLALIKPSRLVEAEIQVT